jgi:hypothetical protein
MIDAALQPRSTPFIAMFGKENDMKQSENKARHRKSESSESRLILTS